MSQSNINTRSQKFKNSNPTTKKYTNHSKHLKIDTTKTTELEKEINLLNKQIGTLQKQLYDLRTNYDHFKPTTWKNKWLDDSYLKAFYSSLTKEISKFNNSILFVSPSVTDLIKNGSNFQVLSTLTNLNYNEMSYVFFCLNNFNENRHNNETYGLEERGSHWSLLVYDKFKNIFQHYDSINGLNSKHAKAFCQKINPGCKVVEMETLQQSNSFECAVQVMVNTRLVLENISELGTKPHKTDALDPAKTNPCPDLNALSNNTLSCQNNNNLFSTEKYSSQSHNSNHTQDIFVNIDTFKPRTCKPTRTRIEKSIRNRFQLRCQNRFETLVNTKLNTSSISKNDNSLDKLNVCSNMVKHFTQQRKSQSSSKIKSLPSNINVNAKQKSSRRLSKSIQGKNNFEVTPTSNLNSFLTNQSNENSGIADVSTPIATHFT